LNILGGGGGDRDRDRGGGGRGGGGGGGGKPRWMAPSSLAPLLLLLLARACCATATATADNPVLLTKLLTHAGVSVSSSGADLDSPARNAVDGDVAGSHFAATEKSYPWLAVDLGGLAQVTTVEVFGHKADAACDFHLLKDAGAKCDSTTTTATVTATGVQGKHMFEYRGANEGAIIGVSSTACPEERVGADAASGAMCGGVICARLTTAAQVGHLGGALGFPGSFQVTW